MFRMRSRLEVALVAFLLAAGMTTGLEVAVGGSPAMAASKRVTCPDNTTGVTDGSWSIVCTGQTAAEATVTITSAKTTSLRFTVAGASTDTRDGASASFNNDDAIFSADFGLRPGVTQTVDITVSNTGGLSAKGVAVACRGANSLNVFFQR